METFERAYDDMDECVDEEADRLKELYGSTKDNKGSDCAKADFDHQICLKSNADCDGRTSECETEEEAFRDACN